MIKLINDDCLVAMDKLIEQDIVVDAIITDPPYGTTACKWDTVIPFDQMWLRLNKLIKPNGAIVLFGSQPFTSKLICSNIRMFKYEWVWEKDKPSNFALANRHPMKYHENILVFSDGNPPYYKIMTDGHKPMNGQASYGRTSNGSVPDIAVKSKNKGGSTKRNPSSIQKFNTVKHNSKDKGGFHPTQKPVALLEYLIKTYTLENETVLDFTAGSGSCGVACKNLNRKFIGIELDEHYFKIANDRINKPKDTLF